MKKEIHCIVAPKRPETEEELLADLIKRGMRFIRLKGKKPYGFGFYDEMLEVEDILPWIGHPKNDLGFEPYSIGLAVIDLDGDRDQSKPDRKKIARVRDAIAAKYGEPVIERYSSSGKKSGKRHLYYGIESRGAPIGRNAEGVARKAGGPDLYAMARGPGTQSALDVKCWHGYIKLPSDPHQRLAYLEAIWDYLAMGVSAPPPEGGWDQAMIDFATYRDRRNKSARRELSVPPSAGETDKEDVDPEKLAEWNRSFVERRSWGEGSGHASANVLGWVAGRQHVWNPDLKESGAAATQANRPDRMDSFENGFKDGLLHPVGPEPILLKGLAVAGRANTETEALRAEWTPGDMVSTPPVFYVSGPTLDGFAEGLEHLGLQLRFHCLELRVEWKTDAGWAEMDDKVDAFWAMRFSDSIRYVLEGKRRQWKLSRTAFMDAVLAYVQNNQYDVLQKVIEYARSKPWDKKLRLQYLMTSKKTFNAPDTALNRLAPFIILGSVLKRILDPGCRLRTTVVLVGGQRIGKSAFLANLLPPGLGSLFSDAFDLSATPKEMLENVRGFALVEVSEMRGRGRADASRWKAFLTRTWDKGIRPAYARHTVSIPRFCTLVGTTDTQSALPIDDADGIAYTRFLPVECRQGFFVEAYLDAKNFRQQLWAEALHYIEQGEIPEVPRELMSQQTEVTRRYVAHPADLSNTVHRALDAWEDGSANVAMAGMTDPIDVPYTKEGGTFTTADFMASAIMREDAYDDRPPGRSEAIRLAQVLRDSGRVEKWDAAKSLTRPGVYLRGWRFLTGPAGAEARKLAKKRRKAREKASEQ